MEVAPAVGENVGDPHPEVVKVAGVATTICPPDKSGSGSVKLAPLTGVAEGLPIVNVRVDVPPATVCAGENALANESAAGSLIFAIRVPVEKSAL